MVEYAILLMTMSAWAFAGLSIVGKDLSSAFNQVNNGLQCGKTTSCTDPTISLVAPTSGSTSGGTVVTITGTNFTGTTAVKFGGTSATSFMVNSSTSITATSPAKTAGTVDITVTIPSATSATSSADSFTFTTPAPTVSSVAPTYGSTAGGTSVTITGTNLTGATAVAFGGVATTFTVDTSTSITATSPAEGAGTVDITVTTPGGTSATGSPDRFTYGNPPTVTSVSPTSGSINGGTSVTITGTNSTGALSVFFGGSSAAYTVNSSTQITATSPAESAGTVDITVTNPYGTSTTGSADQYTFTAPLFGSWAGIAEFGTNTWVAVGGSGSIYRSTGASPPGSWRPEISRTTKGLVGIACPSTTLCVVVGNSGTILTSVDGGLNWLAQASGTTQNLDSVSCPSATVCFAGGESAILKSTDGGTTWVAGTTSYWFEGVSCPTVTVCFGAVGSYIMVTTDGGSTWSISVADAAMGINCPSTLVCVGVGGTSGAGGSALTWTTTNGGSSWTLHQMPSSTHLLDSVWCPSTAVCYVAGMQDAYPNVYYTTNSGSSWSGAISGGGSDGDLADIYCSSTTICAAVGQTLGNDANTSNGTTWYW